MNISKNSWHAKVYRWWYESKHGYEFEKVTANLCPYVRVVLFWALLRYLFLSKKWRIITSWTALGLLLEYMLYLRAGWQGLGIEGGVILCIVAFCGALLGILYLEQMYKKRPYNPNSFGRVLKAYARSFHDRICPFITIQ